MSVVKNKYIKINKFTRPGNKLVGVKGIIIHWTANPGAPAINHFNYFNNGAGGRYASAHIFVDSKEALCIVPQDEVTYAANETGKSKVAKFNGNFGYTNGNANGCTISLEMCVEKNGEISSTVVQQSVKIVADLCKKYKLTEKDVYRHYDITGKSCPTPFLNDSKFELFKSNVRKELNGNAITIPKPKPITTKPVYFAAMPSTKTIQCKTNVGIYSSTEFNDKTKLRDHYEPGDTVKVVSLAKSKGGTPRFKTSDGHYITANKAYVKKYTPPSKNEVIGTIVVLANDLNYYDSPRWNKATGTVDKNTVLTIVGKVKVDGAYQYKTIVNNYITASSKYVKFTAK